MEQHIPKNRRRCSGHGAAFILRNSDGSILWGLLILITLTGIGLIVTAPTWTSKIRRQQETEFLFRGNQYRLAIQRYYASPPPGVPSELPLSLDDLLIDRRGTTPVRHLRQLFTDPFTGEPFAPLRGKDNRIRGVRGTASLEAFRTTTSMEGVRINGTTYREWTFEFIPPAKPAPDTQTAGRSPAQSVPASGPARGPAQPATPAVDPSPGSQQETEPHPWYWGLERGPRERFKESPPQ